MEVRLTTGMVWDRRVARPGDIINLPDAEARRHIAAGNAEAIVKDRPSKRTN